MGADSIYLMNLKNAVRKFFTSHQRVIGFCRCEFIRTEHVDCANEFAPTRPSTAFFRLIAFALSLSMLWTAPAVLATSNEGAVDVKQGAVMLKNGALLLDVREQEEYAAVHAVGATLIPLGELSARLNELKQYKNKPIAVICRSGRRSARGVDILRNAGFSQVANVDGGTSAWEGAGLPVVRN